jgi:hypothetical protein
MTLHSIKQRTRSVSPRELSGKFAGTDFACEDVEDRVLSEEGVRRVECPPRSDEIRSGQNTHHADHRGGHVQSTSQQDVPA